MNRLHLFCAVTTLALLQTAGCGSGVSGDTWLIAAGGDSVTVSEVGAAWTGMNDENRAVFTDRDNPLGQFLLAYARKMMLEMEIDSRGIMSDPALVSMGRPGSDSRRVWRRSIPSVPGSAG